jgi:hypothetical protein
MTKAQQRDQEPQESMELPEQVESPKRKRISAWWLIPIIPVATILFIRAKAPAPLDLNKLLTAPAPKTDYVKSDLEFLKQMGFGRTETLSKNRGVLDAEIKREVAAKYGMNFISEEVFTSDILRRYDLVIAPVERFLKPIPKKNLDEMRTALQRIYAVDSTENPKLFNNTMHPTDEFKSENYVTRSVNGVTWIVGETFHDEYDWKVSIAAPKSYFDLEDLEFSDKLMSWAFPEPKDPIIIKRYKGGYIILTAWDE